jgi:hypothetical protein
MAAAQDWWRVETSRSDTEHQRFNKRPGRVLLIEVNVFKVLNFQSTAS